MSFRIRDIDPAHDEAAAITFIEGSQRFEHAIAPDRRLDAAVGREYFAELTQAAGERQGRMFVAEVDGRAVGWAVFVVEIAQLFVVEDQRTYGYIAELFVEEAVRGQGAGRALIAACEEEASRLGLGQIRIGVLAGNTRAVGVYQSAGYAPYHLELRKTL